MSLITPARIQFQGPIPVAPDFGDVYHSMDGGLEQSIRVFLEGNGLPDRWRQRSSFQILELGFGLGLNFLACWDAWRRSEHAADARLHFVSVEQFPLTREDLRRTWQSHATLAPLARLLVDAWPPLLSGFHTLEFDAGRVCLTLLLGDAQELLPELSMAADAVFLDGFSPARNPRLWDEAILGQVARQCTWQATLATWCVAGSVRRALEHKGFTVHRRPGFGRKRERLEACFDRIPEANFRRMATPSRNVALASTLSPRSQRQALVVGAGLGGCLVAERLASLGWQVTLLDRRGIPAAEASGNPAGILRPVLSRDDNIASRLARAGFLHTLATLSRLQGKSAVLRYQLRGVLHLAADDAHEANQRRNAGERPLPPEFARFLEREEASHLAGMPLPRGGWHFPRGGWIDPASYCLAALESAGDAVRPLWHADVAGLQRAGDAWEARDADGHVLARAAVAILAPGAGATAFAQASGLPLSLFRGQITQIGQNPLPAQAPVLCQDGYLIPGLETGLCIGATYDEEADLGPRDADSQKNLERLGRLLPDFVLPEKTRLERVGLRCVAPDRLPLIGAVAGEPDLYAVMGLASRGLVWSSLGAAVISALLEGLPLPLERTLLRAVSPARFQ
ncbi:MAG: bifunctional tRNA (5-methylaminomethyl-2-thiouridine)(34)-methyltransferase MnmD/FAD-dependent 5-carboxymethylaminomethyl-2-thiouridine(34) oxidoreductase MnmC [Betaproteobacteria bacterium]|nr:bifunctional tRNA (5-methylaminomethyl-2-thiouridine)(34)-methyltransferase MnmD/FAD-dependent 5-carboxymethylaminomethyl-2-thiouridine(34) oxidoreductase MnmC [Betaproteobacteria bacterium]